MPSVEIKPVTKFNWQDVLQIEIRDDQKRLLPPVVFFMARAFVRPDNEVAMPFAIYDGEKVVGFFCLDYMPGSSDNYWICGFMIDKKYQRKGYGKASLNKIVEYLKQYHPKVESLGLTVSPQNFAAQKLYKDFGFVDTGQVYKGELVWRVGIIENK
jgi:diamine N-acetyltransferase